jgi:predicted  nucleic acid-binding Zn-ribbon protein
MNTLKTTMSKIAQIEQPERTDLAKHEVELALVDDVKKFTEELNKLFPEASATEDKLDKIIQELFPLLNKSQILVKKIKEVQDKSDAVQVKFVAAIKELGLNPSESKENFALFNIKDSIETRRERIVNLIEALATRTSKI